MSISILKRTPSIDWKEGTAVEVAEEDAEDLDLDAVETDPLVAEADTATLRDLDRDPVELAVELL